MEKYEEDAAGMAMRETEEGETTFRRCESGSSWIHQPERPKNTTR